MHSKKSFGHDTEKRDDSSCNSSQQLSADFNQLNLASDFKQMQDNYQQAE
jgi:hypothetical protein